MSEKIIVSRHPAAIEFILREMPEFAGAEIKGSVNSEDVAGKIVAGNLPLELAAKAEVVFAICFSGPPPRGQEYGLKEMEAAGAKIKAFRVMEV
jgi:hypothetical protein